MVDLLQQHHDGGRRFEPTEFIEEGQRVAVRVRVSDRRSDQGSGEVFKVFTFAEPGDQSALLQAVLLQDCAGRDDALAHLSAE